MKYYLKSGAIIYAFPLDGSQDDLITGDMQEMSFSDVQVRLTPIPIEPNREELVEMALAKVRVMRVDFFNILAGLQSEATARGNHADAMAIAVVQQGARDITATDLSACTSRDEIDAVFLAAWLMLLSGAPASVVRAFGALAA